MSDCHRTGNQQYKNILYRPTTPHIGQCRKCGETFMRIYTSEQEVDLWYENAGKLARESARAIGQRRKPNYGEPPLAGWGEWQGWSSSAVQYVIQEGL